MKKYSWPFFIVLVTILMSFFVLTDIVHPIRPLITFLFFFLCPGMAFVRLVQITHPFIELTIGVALSLAFGQLISMTVLYIGLWSLSVNVFLLTLLSLIGAILQIIQIKVRQQTAVSAAPAAR